MGKSIAVFGLGRFGRSLAYNLYDLGLEVMAVDKDPDMVEDAQDKVTVAIEADVSKPDAVKGLGVENMDIVIVAMGSDLTASIMAVMVCKELGVPKVYAKAADERMGAILRRIGADRVLFPEEESGERMARTLASDSIMELFEIGGSLCLVEVRPKKDWIGKNLRELKLREKQRINVVAVRNKKGTHTIVDPDAPIQEDEFLLVILHKKDLKEFRD